jgi:hypothetical protein
VLLPEGEDEIQAEPPIEEQRRMYQRVVERMLALWARAVQQDSHSYYQAAMKAAWTDRAIDYGEDWSPSEADLAVALEEVWSEATSWSSRLIRCTGGCGPIDVRLVKRIGRT